MYPIIFLLAFINAYLLLRMYPRKQPLPLPVEEVAVVETKKGFLHGFLKVFTPLTKNLVKKLKLPGLSRRLVMAGSPINVPEFLAFEILSTILIPVFLTTLIKTDLVLVAVYFLIGFLLPLLWLNIKIRKRHFQIARDIPHVMDLLNLCVGAGMDFMLAVNRITREFKKCPLTEELTELWREYQMGLTRRDALKNMAKRVGLADISSFVRTLIQADRMGAPMSEALRIQADEVRTRRFQRAETQALKAPIKLLFPLIFFILPIILIIVGAPILLQFMKGGGIRF